MSHKVLEVTFSTQSQSNAPGRFTVPSEVCQALGIDMGAQVELEVRAGGAWHGPVVKQLVSDREPSPVGEMRDWMEAGEEITVRVRPA